MDEVGLPVWLKSEILTVRRELSASKQMIDRFGLLAIGSPRNGHERLWRALKESCSPVSAIPRMHHLRYQEYKAD